MFQITVSLTVPPPPLKSRLTLSLCMPGLKMPPRNPGHFSVRPPDTSVPGTMQCARAVVTSAPSTVMCPPTTVPEANTRMSRSKFWFVAYRPDAGEMTRPEAVGPGTTCRKGPWSFAKLLVFRTWVPALWSPLKGVTVAGHPAATASADALNQSPRWNVWIGLNGGLRDASGNGAAGCTIGAGPLPG